MKATVTLVVITICIVHAKDIATINFIRSYIENEQKPTDIIINHLCWSQYIEMKLLNMVMNTGNKGSNSVYALHRYKDHGIMFLLDLDCPYAEEAIMNATIRKLFGSPYRWLVLSEDHERLKSSILWDSPFLTDSDLVLAEKTQYGYILTELHRTSMNTSMVLTTRGVYNGTLVDTRPHREIFRRRRNLMRSTLTMANVVQDSNATLYHLPREDRLHLHHDTTSKACWMNVNLAFQMLNATPRLIFSHRWGYKYKGQWSGMIRDIETNKADLGTNCLATNMERLDVVTYTDMMAHFRVAFILRQPPLSYVSNIFSLPFSANVWIAIAVCATLAMFTLYLASKWEVRNGKSLSQLDGTMGDSFLLIMSAVSQQGCVIEPRRVSGRIMVWIFFTALMALYAAYNANIVVLLQAPSNSIRTLAQLANSKITLAAHDIDYSYFIFKIYKDPIHYSIYRKIEPEKGKYQYYDIYEGVEKIRQGLFAFHAITEQVYRRIEQTFLDSEKCDLVEIDYLNGFDPFVPVKKGSPYVEILKVVFKQIRESGIRAGISKRMLASKPHCATKLAAFSSVGVLDIKPVLLLMIYGVTLSLFILLLEIVHFKLTKKKRKTVAKLNLKRGKQGTD